MVHVFKLLFFLVILQAALTSSVVYGTSSLIKTYAEGKNFNARTEVITSDVEKCPDVSDTMVALAPDELWNLVKDEHGCTFKVKITCINDIAEDEEDECTELDHVDVRIVGSTGQTPDTDMTESFILHKKPFEMIAKTGVPEIMIDIDDPDVSSP